MANEHLTDWSLCCLCQHNNSNPLVNPANVKRFQDSSYDRLQDRLIRLNELDAVPISFKNIDRLDNGNGIANNLKRNNALWHKVCFDSCNESKIKRASKRKVAQPINEDPCSVKKRLRRTLFEDGCEPGGCFFCNKEDSKFGELHRVETLTLDERIRRLATELQDHQLLTKLAAGDMTATDAVYHKNCLTSFYNRHRSFVRRNTQTSTKNEETLANNKATAFAELVTYIEGFESENGKENIFKLSDLNRIYTNRLKELGTDVLSNSSHLKDKLLSAIPSLSEHKSKYETVLSFRTHVGNTLLAAKQSDLENDRLILLRASSIVRKDIFRTKHQFRGSLLDNQYKETPETLRLLVEMIINGSDISKETENEENTTNIVDSLVQLLVFNTLKRKKKDTAYQRHKPERETMLPLYLGLLVHGKTRKRELVDILHGRGLCVSYTRVLQISSEIANSVITQFEESGVVCPTFLKDNVFTTGNLDNIDHNTSSNTSTDSFHGTAISLTQHVTENENVSPVLLQLQSASNEKTKSLPESYSDIEPVVFKNKLPLPRRPTREDIKCESLEHTVTSQIEWLNKVQEVSNADTLGNDEYISWSGHFAAKQDTATLRPPAISVLLPLFKEEAHSVAMIKHGMKIVRDATALKNPGQIPVLTVDQPLYVLAKKIQWTWPTEFSENKFVVMMGGLHIEMALLKCIGDWLDGSGWLSALTSAEIITPGRAESVQRGSSTSRGQWIHQIFAASLYILQHKAYQVYTETDGLQSGVVMPFPIWCTSMATAEHPQFLYWNKTLQLQLLFLQFLQAQREASFDKYSQTLRQVLPWMFAMDHVHYARWLSIHLEDLENLESDCPDVHAEFSQGKFVTQRSSRKFSCIAHDQVHEQLNALLKGDGGFVGLTESPETLNRWAVSSPELTRILSEVTSETRKQSTDHHEQSRSAQNRFFVQTKCLVAAIEDIGNPFMEKSSDLITLDTKIVQTDDAVQSVNNADLLGRMQYDTFVNDCIKGDNSIYDPIKKNSLPLFRAGSKGIAKKSSKVKNIKSDVRLFSRMYIACQSRDGDLDTFFEHENHPWPPALADQNRPRTGNKADLVTCLESHADSTMNCPNVEMKIIDGAALVQTLDPIKSKTKVQTFSDYADNVFLPVIRKHLESVSRIDLVWDTYKDQSLKQFARQMRGTGEYVRVTPKTLVPSNWKSFLRNNNNKVELFQFLARTIENMETENDKYVITTFNDGIRRSKLEVSEDKEQPFTPALQPCNHEEADTRIPLHAVNAFNSGMKDILLYATDTDVLVLSVALASLYPECTLWLAFGHSESFRYIPTHDIAKQLGPEASWGLIFLHAFSGCDTVSFFSGIGKRTAFKTWLSQPDVVTLSKKLSTPSVSLSDEDIGVLERFVVLLYSKTAVYTSVNEARKYLFSLKNRQIENIPPSKAALEQHIYRAIYQSAFVWGQMLCSVQILPSPSDWGWMLEDDVWTPRWSTLPEASKGCRELIRCGCKAACAGRCKCLKANLPCTFLCFCQAGCDRM